MNWNWEYFSILDEGEQSLIKWQYRQHGGFFMSLWDTISRADRDNLNALERAFPLHVKAYRNFVETRDWWTNIQENLFEVETHVDQV